MTNNVYVLHQWVDVKNLKPMETTVIILGDTWGSVRYSNGQGESGPMWMIATDVTKAMTNMGSKYITCYYDKDRHLLTSEKCEYSIMINLKTVLAYNDCNRVRLYTENNNDSWFNCDEDVFKKIIEGAKQYEAI